MNNLKTAIIDIGSNTIRLVLYEYDYKKGLHEFGNIKTVARLRTYLLPNGEMSEQGIQVVVNTIKSFKKILDDFEVTDIKAAATAAIRQAKNSQDILQLLKAETGITIELLSEEDEAYFGYIAVAHSMDTPSAVTIDIGGGSTELTVFVEKKLHQTFSFPFGTVSLKQKFVSGEKINLEEKKELRQFIKKQFENIDWIVNAKLPVIAIGGSARNIAQVHQHFINYPISGVHQYEMAKEDLTNLRHYFAKTTFEQLKQMDGLSSDRADIIEIALEVFHVLMEVVDTNSFQISKKGLREGLIMNRVLQSDANAFDMYNVFEENAKRLTYEYGRSEKEVETLVLLTEQFYEECSRLNLLHVHNEQFDLIKKAIKVYSIGEYIEIDSASQHTFYLIANQSIAGMTHINRVKLALLASYKNREYFNHFSNPFASWFTRDELKALRENGALLKFIYGLNASKRNVVKTIKLEMKDENIHVNIYTKNSAMAEMYQAERQKKHIERLFRKPVQIYFHKEGWE